MQHDLTFCYLILINDTLVQDIVVNQWRCPMSTFEEYGWLYFCLTRTQWQFQAVLGLHHVNQKTSHSLRCGILAVVLWMNMMSENGAIVCVCGGGVRDWNLPLDMAFVVRLPCRGIVLYRVLQQNGHVRSKTMFHHRLGAGLWNKSRTCAGNLPSLRF